MRFVLPRSNLEHVVVPEPSCVRAPLCYFACRGIEFVGSCKMCNLVFLEVICNEKESFLLSCHTFSCCIVLVAYEVSEFFVLRTGFFCSLRGSLSLLHG